jgi:hypothetical protein
MVLALGVRPSGLIGTRRCDGIKLKRSLIPLKT